MTEEEARSRIATDVPRETMERLERLAGLVINENDRQNLISPSTVPVIWTRHILDSAQLIWLAGQRPGIWLDIGSGGGFPGLVVGILRTDNTVLVEPRAKRAAFLEEAIAVLGMKERVAVVQSRVETARLQEKAGIISARAVAALPSLLGMAVDHADQNTLWLLPKGRSASREVADARREWQGVFSLEPSLSDPDSAIVIVRGVRRKKSG